MLFFPYFIVFALNCLICKLFQPNIAKILFYSFNAEIHYQIVNLQRQYLQFYFHTLNILVKKLKTQFLVRQRTSIGLKRLQILKNTLVLINRILLTFPIYQIYRFLHLFSIVKLQHVTFFFFIFVFCTIFKIVSYVCLIQKLIQLILIFLVYTKYLNKLLHLYVLNLINFARNFQKLVNILFALFFADFVFCFRKLQYFLLYQNILELFDIFLLVFFYFLQLIFSYVFLVSLQIQKNLTR